MYTFPSTIPCNDKSEVWKLQKFLFRECEEILGSRDKSKIIFQPEFKEGAPFIIHNYEMNGAGAILSKNASTYWPTLLFELAHETVHLLNPVIEANYLEEGFAALFSLEMSNKFGDSQGNYINTEYQIALGLLKQIPENIWEVGKLIRDNFGSFSNFSPDDLYKLFPQWGYLHCLKLLTPFHQSKKNKLVRLDFMNDDGHLVTNLSLNKEEINYNLMYEDNIVGDVFGQVTEYGVLLTVIKIYPVELRNIGLGYNIFKSLFIPLNEKIQIQVIVGSWHADDEFKDYEEGKSTNLKIYQDSQVSGDSEDISAFKTATGKWAKKLGFTSCKISSISTESVVVNFFKSSETDF